LLQEEDRGEEDSIDAVMAEARLTVHEPRVKVDLTKYVEHHAFAFDDVLDEEVTNDAVYRSTVQPLVATIFRNGKVITCIYYMLNRMQGQEDTCRYHLQIKQGAPCSTTHY